MIENTNKTLRCRSTCVAILNSFTCPNCPRGQFGNISKNNNSGPNSSDVDRLLLHQLLRRHQIRQVHPGIIPVRSWSDKQFVSHEPKSNHEHTFSVEISPICRKNQMIICLPPKVAQAWEIPAPPSFSSRSPTLSASSTPSLLCSTFLDANQ